MEERRKGRPRSLQADEAIRRSTLAILGEVGFEKLTIDAIAERSGVGKPTIYRRWKSKEELIVDVLGEMKTAPTVPDTGSLEGDLAALAQEFDGIMASPLGKRIFLLISHMFAEDPPMGRRYWEHFGQPRLQGFRLVFERAQARGELKPLLDIDLIIEMFAGLLFFHATMRPEGDGGEAARKLLPLVLEGIRARG